MNPIEAFRQEVADSIEKLGEAEDLKELTWEWIRRVSAYRYTHNFSWLGRPVIQFPQDLVAMQELMWKVKPDLIIETGVAHGGSLIFHATMLAMLEYEEAVQNGTVLDPARPKRKVIGIDIDIREHNREKIEGHPMASRIELVQGSSTDSDVVEEVRRRAQGFGTIMVSLDSNHTHDHVLEELKAYAPLTSSGSYCLVMDTAIEDMPDNFFPDRPWGVGDNPKTAMWAYLKDLEKAPGIGVDGKPLQFAIDKAVEAKILITVAPDGYLRRL